MTSPLSATAGLRYTHEKKDINNAGGLYRLDDPDTSVPGSVYSYTDSTTHGAWTPKLGLEMKLPRGALTYVSATWLDATYEHYIAVAVGGATGDVSGNPLNNAPEWGGRLWVDWTGAIGPSGRLSLTADVTGQSTVFYTPFNDGIQRQGAYGLLGARAKYGPSHRRWSVNAYARNVTNTDYIMATFGTSTRGVWRASWRHAAVCPRIRSEAAAGHQSGAGPLPRSAKACAMANARENVSA